MTCHLHGPYRSQPITRFVYCELPAFDGTIRLRTYTLTSCTEVPSEQSQMVRRMNLRLCAPDRRRRPLRRRATTIRALPGDEGFGLRQIHPSWRGEGGCVRTSRPAAAQSSGSVVRSAGAATQPLRRRAASSSPPQAAQHIGRIARHMPSWRRPRFPLNRRGGLFPSASQRGLR